MLITVNGKTEEISKKLSLAELIAGKGLIADKLVIEHNFQIAPKEKWRSIYLQENDNLEIVSFVGGG